MARNRPSSAGGTRVARHPTYVGSAVWNTRSARLLSSRTMNQMWLARGSRMAKVGRKRPRPPAPYLATRHHVCVCVAARGERCSTPTRHPHGTHACGSGIGGLYGSAPGRPWCQSCSSWLLSARQLSRGPGSSMRTGRARYNPLTALLGTRHAADSAQVPQSTRLVALSRWQGGCDCGSGTDGHTVSTSRAPWPW